MAIYYVIAMLQGLSALALWGRGANALVSLAILVPATLVAAGRWMIDADYLPYREMYQQVPTLPGMSWDAISSIYGETGYLLATSALKTAGVDYFLAFAIFAVIAVSTKYLVALRVSSAAAYVMALYLCIHYVTIEIIQIRWAIASSIIIYAYVAYFYGQPRLALAALAAACLLHYYSIVYVLLYFAVRLPRIILLVALFFAFLIPVLLRPDMLAFGFLESSDLYVARRAVRYFQEGLSQVGLLSYARHILFFAMLLFLRSVTQHENRTFSKLDDYIERVSLVVFAAAIGVSFIPIMYFRSAVLSDFFMAMLAVIYLQRIPQPATRVFIALVVIIPHVLWAFIDIKNYAEVSRLLPYQSWLEHLVL